MEILIIGDLHFKLDNINQCNQLIAHVDELLSIVSSIILLGDVLHYHEKLYSFVLNRFVNFINKITKPIIILVGNHDMINNQVFCDPSGHWMNCLKMMKNVVIIDVPQYISIDGIKFLASPYVYKGRLKEAFKKFNVDPSEAEYCLLHQEIKNCQMGAIKSEDGDEYEWSTPCFSGHIHDSQQVGNVFYVGSAFEHSFGSKQCYLTLLNSITKEITRIPSKVSSRTIIKLKLIDGNVSMPTIMPEEKNLNKCIVVVDCIESFNQWLKSEQGQTISRSFKLYCEEKIKTKKVFELTDVFKIFKDKIESEYPECKSTMNEFCF
jgi:predicted phosphodiesterase